jgi:hypothetical protein
MPRSQSDISNMTLRIFLQDVGRFYDQIRNLDEYRSLRTQKKEILQFFDESCAYCGQYLRMDDMTEDHLIPMNKASLGLHAWGNVVPSCAGCNKQKHSRPWEQYLDTVCGVNTTLLEERRAKIEGFLLHYKYKPNLHLQSIAENLYQDVGAVAMTLIKLRFKQAEALITKIQSEDRPAHV